MQGAAPGLIVTLLVLVLHALNLPALNEVAKLVFDGYQRAAPRPYHDVGVRVIDIDDESIARLGQWPWPRTDIARLNDKLAEAGAASISYDIVFSEPDRTSPSRMAAILRSNPEAHGDFADIARLPDHDVLLGRSLAKTPSVLAYFLSPQPSKILPPVKAGIAVAGTPPLGAIPDYRGSLSPLPVLSQDAAGAGFITLPDDGDGIVRTAPLLAHIGDQIYPSLSLEALRVAQGAGALVIKSTDGSQEGGGGTLGVVSLKVGDFSVPTTPRGELWMYYTLPRPERTVPAWKVMTGALTPAQMKEKFGGHIVLIGAGAQGLLDVKSTPLSARELGVNVHAEAIEQMIDQKFLVRPDWAFGLERFLILVLGVGMSLLLPSLGALRSGIVAAVVFVAASMASWFAFKNSGLLLAPTFPVLGVVLVYMAGTLFSFLREERARAYIHHAFDRYLSPELVDRIAKDPGQLELGGEERDMTVMFCDIRQFSRISEKLTPHRIIQFLIAFLTPMTDVLLARKATIDKYIGDAILAFWNAPLDDPDHEKNAAQATLEMLEKVAQLNAEAPEVDGAPWPGPVKVGIGLSAGRACVGNMGSSQRLNYSLIGDTVNLASRLEGLTKVYGVPIICNEQLARRLTGFALLELDLVRVVGRDTPERIFALMGPPIFAASDGFSAANAAQTAFLEAYRAQRWDEAEATLKGAGANVGLAALHTLYSHRIAAYRATPPGKGWDGVHDATEK